MGEPIVRTQDLEHVYTARVTEPIRALGGVSLALEPGEHLAVVGANGSGKSTLVRHFNGLLLPTAGEVLVDGLDTRLAAGDRELKKHIRATVGLVFQNPDSQIVATIVREDVAFGPENLGVARAELERRIENALRLVGMDGEAGRPPHMLSAGQRQRVAIAGALAMQPRVLVFDEATAMLDPLGRRALLDVMERLQRGGMTVVQVTHHMNEAARADRVLILDGGAAVADGPPGEVLTDPGRLHAVGLDVPPTVQIARAVAADIPGFPTRLLTVDALVAAVRGRVAPGGAPPPDAPDPGYPPEVGPVGIPPSGGEPVIAVEDLFHVYMEGTPLRHASLHGISLRVYPGEVVAVVGQTGSGKSTLIQHLNGLIRPQAGRVQVAGSDLRRPGLDVRALRRRVGLVFQRPEDQLFERHVGDDVAFGPLQYGVKGEALRERVRWAMGVVGLDFAGFKDRPVFTLSGGQRRRVALAGVLALRPEVLVLDEPTAGLDPRGRDDLLATLERLRREEGLTIVLVTHNMDEVARLADRCYVLAEGRVAAAGTPRSLFSRPEQLSAIGLDVPPAAEVTHRLRAAGYPLAADRVTPGEVAAELVALLREAGGARPARARPGGR